MFKDSAGRISSLLGLFGCLMQLFRVSGLGPSVGVVQSGAHFGRHVKKAPFFERSLGWMAEIPSTPPKELQRFGDPTKFDSQPPP